MAINETSADHVDLTRIPTDKLIAISPTSHPWTKYRYLRKLSSNVILSWHLVGAPISSSFLDSAKSRTFNETWKSFKTDPEKVQANESRPDQLRIEFAFIDRWPLRATFVIVGESHVIQS
ncbi:MAG: hypothetical protein ACI8T1_002140 [Verrucomicrobiales bacterium]|jgi:hypothetical protein